MNCKDKGIANAMRTEIYTGLSDYYANLAYNVFKWDWKTENHIPRTYPEAFLYSQGLCTVYVPKGMDEPVCLPVAYESLKGNIYGEPQTWKAQAVQGSAPEGPDGNILNRENAVLIWNNDTYTATQPYIDTLIGQMVNVELAKRMNVNAQKCPFVFKSPNGVKSLQNKQDFVDFLECEPAFFKSDMSDNSFEIFYSNIPMIAKDLDDVYAEYDSRALQYIGVNCLPVEKKERLLTDEVNINTEERNLAIESKLKQREEACEVMYDILGVECRVSLGDYTEGKEYTEESEEDTEGEE